MKAGVYVRVSTEKEGQKESPDNQKNLFLNLLQEKGWDLYDFYVDFESGTKARKRNEFQRLVKDAEEGKLDIILAKELGRLARSGRLSYSLRDLYLQQGIHIMTLDGAINSLNDDLDKFGLFAWFYEYEAQTASRRIKDTLKTKALSGQFMGATPPYGYKVSEGHRQLIKRNDETVEVVKRIFSDYINGKGYDKIARELSEERVPTPSNLAGKKNPSSFWNGSSVRIILENPHYTGDLVQQRETSMSVTTDERKQNQPNDQVIIENTHEAIISKEDFNLVKSLIEQRKRHRPVTSKHLFTDIAKCAKCGKSMHFKQNRKGYVCGNFNKRGITACTDHHIREDEIKRIIKSDIKKLYKKLNQKNFMNTVQKKITDILAKDQNQLAKIDSTIDKLHNEKTQALKKNMADEISKDDYDRLISANNNEIEDLLKQKHELSGVIDNQSEVLDIQELHKALETFLSDPVITKETLNKLIDKIEVEENGGLSIYYRFSAPLISSTFFEATHSTPHD
ncbi:recombinase family protein [Alkalibacillus salilacus]|uniref:DNA invertase Pin-like site-specific DNA recombinase/ssDNA-binding Zn-finger/Zn-ribbon topoisomerase 1 n=1 Tax=Alkalibacillus salilacus TaxID=284582 RepID=A0ABT9VFM6_9BACI|nr:recombinase family protein [Alkalibacillus salilacus]MDQ0159738.1 DNA invertase Pin-like site-specific DNA recombinase/ssDNA-binding Zn-finger/Zn-ribbon topoisomerase 1 [Alkalibacillus salilacus]